MGLNPHPEIIKQARSVVINLGNNVHNPIRDDNNLLRSFSPHDRNDIIECHGRSFRVFIFAVFGKVEGAA